MPGNIKTKKLFLEDEHGGVDIELKRIGTTLEFNQKQIGLISNAFTEISTEPVQDLFVLGYSNLNNDCVMGSNLTVHDNLSFNNGIKVNNLEFGSSIAIGYDTGIDSEPHAIAIGSEAGKEMQSSETIAIGKNAGSSNQQLGSIAIGTGAGKTTQGTNSIAIGYGTGEVSQGSDSIAIGSVSIVPDSSIILSANGIVLEDAVFGGFHVKPIRKPDETITEILAYNTSRNEIIRTDTVPNATQLYMTDITSAAHNGIYPISLWGGSGDGNKSIYGSNKLYFVPGTSELTIKGILKAGDEQGPLYGLKINDWQIYESEHENLVFSYNSSTKLQINDTGSIHCYGDVITSGNVKTTSSLYVNSTEISTYNGEFRVNPIRKPNETITEILAYNTSRNEIIRTDTVPHATTADRLSSVLQGEDAIALGFDESFIPNRYGVYAGPMANFEVSAILDPFTNLQSDLIQGLQTVASGFNGLNRLQFEDPVLDGFLEGAVNSIPGGSTIKQGIDWVGDKIGLNLSFRKQMQTAAIKTSDNPTSNVGGLLDTNINPTLRIGEILNTSGYKSMVLFNEDTKELGYSTICPIPVNFVEPETLTSFFFFNLPSPRYHLLGSLPLGEVGYDKLIKFDNAYFIEDDKLYISENSYIDYSWRSRTVEAYFSFPVYENTLTLSASQAISLRCNSVRHTITDDDFTLKGLIRAGEYYDKGSSYGFKTGKWHIFQYDNSNNNLHFQYAGVSRGFVDSSSSTNNEMNFTGQHRCISKKIINEHINIGYIVNSTGDFKKINSNSHNKINNISINESLPFIEYSNIANDKKVFGVISNKEDINDDYREHKSGVFVSSLIKNRDDNRIIVNSLGEGAIWVSNFNGPLENGDYITTSNIPGIGMKQDSEMLMNYTVAKITMDCDFNPKNEIKNKLKYITTSNTHTQPKIQIKTKTATEIVFEDGKYIQKTIEKEYKEEVQEEVQLYDETGNIIGNTFITIMETITDEKKEIQFDDNGNPIYENELDENGQVQYIPEYEMKYVKLDGTIITEEEYNTASEGTAYKMAFVGCTYHCG